MKLLRLRLENFRSFAEADLDLTVDGVIAVTGHNGAGKSTLVQAVEWALYGSRRGRGALSPQRDGTHGSEACLVELDFQVAGHSYTVRRKHAGDSTLTDRETQTELARGAVAVSSTIASILGLSRDVFEGTFYARQGEVQALDSSNQQDRRKRLELLLGIERVRRAVDLAQADARSQSTVVATLSSECPDVDALGAEVDRLRREAQKAAPAVTGAETELKSARERHKAAQAQGDELGRREKEARKRQEVVTETAEAKARTEARVETLRDQVAAAGRAVHQAEQLRPLAAKLPQLSTLEREEDLRRQRHERATELRRRERKALEDAAGLTDRLARLNPPGNGSGKSPDEELSSVRGELDGVVKDLRRVAESVGVARKRRDAALAALVSATRASEIKADLARLGDAETKLDATSGRAHELKAARTHVVEAIEHDAEHQRVVAAEGANATCPRCRRPYGEDWQAILDDFDRDLDAARKKEKELAAKIEDTEAGISAFRDAAVRVRALGAERKSLGAVGDQAELRKRLEAAEAYVEQGESGERKLRRREEELRELQPQLDAAAAAQRESDKRQAEIVAEKQQVEQKIEMLAQELESLGTNGYNPDGHATVRQEQKAASDASTGLARLQSQVDQLPLLRRQLEAAERGAQESVDAHRRAETAVSEVAPPADALEQAQERLRETADAVDAAQTALSESKLQAEREDGAVAGAVERLKDARSAAKKLKTERVEERMRMEVASALAAYRDHVASSAKPQLEREASRLLALVTRGRYVSVEIADDYSFRIFDDGKAHRLGRFSGGEKDLANLCLRLALSKALATQQGIEAGFVILDEVFGSQDRERRELVLGQLRELRNEFRQVILISHVREVVDYSDHHIEVEHVEGASVITQSSP